MKSIHVQKSLKETFSPQYRVVLSFNENELQGLLKRYNKWLEEHLLDENAFSFGKWLKKEAIG